MVSKTDVKGSGSLGAVDLELDIIFSMYVLHVIGPREPVTTTYNGYTR